MRPRLRRPSSVFPQPPCRHAPDDDELARARCERCRQPICHRCAHLEGLQQLCPQDARWPADPPLSIRGFPITFALLAVNIGMLLMAGVRSGHPGGLLAPEPYQLCRLGGLNSPAVLGHGQYWRLLSAIALHVSVLHLALNGYGLLLFGPALEVALGWWRFLMVYLGAGVAGAAVSLAVYHPRLGVGASGAIFGIGAALVVVFYHYRVGIGASVWTYVAVIVSVSLILSAVHVGVDNAAHVGGLLTGLVAAALLIRRRHRLVTAIGLLLPILAAGALVLVAATAFTPTLVGEPTCLDTLFIGA